MYYAWSKGFLEAGKKRLAGDAARAATSDEVRDLRRESGALKEVVADLTLENRLLKKTRTAKSAVFQALVARCRRGVARWLEPRPAYRIASGCCARPAGSARLAAARCGSAMRTAAPW
jgi:hypothetical protein